MSRESLRVMSPTLGGLKDAKVSGAATIRAHQRGSRIDIDSRILMMAEAEYERQFSQPIWRVRERGGLCYGEVLTLLAEAVVRFAPDDALIPKTLTRGAPDDA